MTDHPQPSTHLISSAATRSAASLFGFGIPLLWFLVPLVLVFIFLAEIATPIGMNLPVCYIAALVLVVALAGIREKVLAAVTCTALMIVAFFFSLGSPAGYTWVSAMNYGLAVVMIWVVAALSIRHRRVEVNMQTNQRVANERLALINTIYALAPVGLCFVDRELRYVSVNDALAEMIGQPPGLFLGKRVRDTVPDLATAIEAHLLRVIEVGQPIIDVEVSGPLANRASERRQWLCSYYPVQTAGELLGVNVAVRDITRRKQAEVDTLFLLDLGECIRFAANAEELLWAVAVALGEHLGVSRCAFVEVDTEADHISVQRDYHPHVPSMAGVYQLSSFSPAVVEAGKAGEIVTINDVAADQRTAAYVDAYHALNVGGMVGAPLLRDGKLVCGLVVTTAGAHDWSEREVTLVNVVAERTWLAVEKLRLDQVLRETDKSLRDADRRKDEFLATLAHELRNPLSLIRNVVTLQKSPGTLEYDVNWGRDIIDRQVNYLTRLTDDLFDVSRITRDKLALQKEPLDLAEVIKAAIESSRPLIDQRQHRLTVNLPELPIPVDGDRVRLTQVFMNLLNNAAKYSPDPGQIQVDVNIRSGIAVARVKDTGIGIAAENLPHLFDLFYQVDRTYTRAEGGLGLGLTLVHRLVELHGGRIEARSDGLLRGSEFTVRLPLLADRTALQGEPKETAKGDLTAAARSRRILVADDFPESAATLARLLRQDGNEVQIAQDGIEAFEVAARFRPDVIVLDIAMPKLNGYETARKIREQTWGKNAILIALTGWGQKQDRQRTQEAGFDAHLTKPVNYDAIMEILTELTAGSPATTGREPACPSANGQATVTPPAAKGY